MEERSAGFRDANIRKSQPGRKRKATIFEHPIDFVGIPTEEFMREATFLQPPVPRARNIQLTDKTLSEERKDKGLFNISNILKNITTVLVAGNTGKRRPQTDCSQRGSSPFVVGLDGIRRKRNPTSFETFERIHGSATPEDKAQRIEALNRTGILTSERRGSEPFATSLFESFEAEDVPLLEEAEGPRSPFATQIELEERKRIMPADDPDVDVAPMEITQMLEQDVLDDDDDFGQEIRSTEEKTPG